MPKNDEFARAAELAAERNAEAAISDAIDATSNEIFGAAFGQEETVLDETGDRSIEGMGDGLEGQHEADEAEGEESEDETESEGESEREAKDGETEKEAAQAATQQDDQKPQEREGRVPPGRLREAAERARAAEAERDTLKTALETERTKNRSELDTVKGQLAALTQLLQRQNQQGEKPDDTKPATDQPIDLFENPQGFVESVDKKLDTNLQSVIQRLEEQRLATSFAIARGFHKEVFDKAFAAAHNLDRSNPENAAMLQRIGTSHDPGEALVSWFKRAETLREVGDDPTAYRERVAKETRQALAQDPEFRKQLLAELRAEAEGTGTPNTVTRIPPSLNGARGTRPVGDTSILSDDPQAIFDSGFAAQR